MRSLFSFKGRIDRAQYWLASLGLGVIATVVFGLLAAMTMALVPPDAAGNIGLPNAANPAVAVIGLIAFLLIVLTLWASTAIGAKRCHDLGRSGWYLLLGLVPLANIWLMIEIMFVPGEPRDNKWGPAIPARQQPE